MKYLDPKVIVERVRSRSMGISAATQNVIEEICAEANAVLKEAFEPIVKVQTVRDWYGAYKTLAPPMDIPTTWAAVSAACVKVEQAKVDALATRTGFDWHCRECDPKRPRVRAMNAPTCYTCGTKMTVAS